MREHLFPDGPVMGAVGTDIEPVADILLLQDATKPFVIGAAAIPLGGTQDNAHIPDGGIAGIGDEIYRVIEIDVVVIVSIDE
jgi:hypothetical protein